MEYSLKFREDNANNSRNSSPFKDSLKKLYYQSKAKEAESLSRLKARSKALERTASAHKGSSNKGSQARNNVLDMQVNSSIINK